MHLVSEVAVAGGTARSQVVSGALTREEQLLLSLARIQLSEADRARAEALSPQADWQEVARLARRGGIGGLVASHLEQFDVPLPVRRSLAALALKVEAYNRLLVKVAVDLCSAARGSGLTLIPLKGIALNLAEPYGDLSLRGQSDIDLLARPDEFDALQRLFAQMGCRPSPDNEYSRRHQHHLRFAYGSERAPLLVELHWTAYFVPFHHDAVDAAVLDRARVHDGPGGALQVLEPCDMLLSVSLHLAVHRYREQLKWLVDVAELGRAFAHELDAETLWERAGKMRATRAVAYVFWLASQLLDAPLPVPPRAFRRTRLLRRLSGPDQIVRSERQPSWLRRALIDMTSHDSLAHGMWALSRKGLELLDRRRMKGYWSPS